MCCRLSVCLSVCLLEIPNLTTLSPLSLIIIYHHHHHDYHHHHHYHHYLRCIISKTKQEIGLNHDFFTFHLHSTPHVGSPSKYCHNVWCRKNRMVCLSAGEKSLRICLFVSTQYKNVTDRRTDRRRATAKAALMHNIARQKPCSLQRLRVVLMVDSINNAAAADLEPTILHPGTLGKLFYLQY